MDTFFGAIKLGSDRKKRRHRVFRVGKRVHRHCAITPHSLLGQVRSITPLEFDLVDDRTNDDNDYK